MFADATKGSITEADVTRGKAQLRSESAQLEQRVKNKAPSDFHFFPLCLLYIVHRRVPLFFTGNKGALKKTHTHTYGHTHTHMPVLAHAHVCVAN